MSLFLNPMEGEQDISTISLKSILVRVFRGGDLCKLRIRILLPLLSIPVNKAANSFSHFCSSLGSHDRILPISDDAVFSFVVFSLIPEQYHRLPTQNQFSQDNGVLIVTHIVVLPNPCSSAQKPGRYWQKRMVYSLVCLLCPFMNGLIVFSRPQCAFRTHPNSMI